MEHSIISEPGLLISDNASGISGMTPLSDEIERMSGTIRYRTVFFPHGRDMLNAAKVNARVSYFPPPAFADLFAFFGRILPFQNPFKYTRSSRVNQHMPLECTGRAAGASIFRPAKSISCIESSNLTNS
jgi:hypothetical protein